MLTKSKINKLLYEFEKFNLSKNSIIESFRALEKMHKNNFYITTPIYYPSGKPHMGRLFKYYC